MSSPQRGKITAWKDEKGYGFITPANGGRDIFLHASRLPAGLKRPPLNVDVTYVVGYDSQQRPQVISVHFERAPITISIFPAILVGIFFIVLAMLIVLTHTTPLLFVAYAAISGFTFIVYVLDKTSALQGERRVPENTLHLLELLGGWPGALIAQQYYRHKNRKASYQAIYWVVAVVNLALLAGYF
ncbi:MAG: DUF1294 domain-containing protein, partial [Oscillochloris sp.]|nr:DUF1294 domain-containing protein [Oscillochloris sp.]